MGHGLHWKSLRNLNAYIHSCQFVQNCQFPEVYTWLETPSLVVFHQPSHQISIGLIFLIYTLDQITFCWEPFHFLLPSEQKSNLLRLESKLFQALTFAASLFPAHPCFLLPNPQPSKPNQNLAISPIFASLCSHNYCYCGTISSFTPTSVGPFQPSSPVSVLILLFLWM